MAEQRKSDKEALTAGVRNLKPAEVLLLYHAIENADESKQASFDQTIKSEVEDYALSLLGTGDYETQYNTLDKTYGTKSYEEGLEDAVIALNTATSKAETDLTWYRENYAYLKSAYEEAAQTVLKNEGIELDFDLATNYSESNAQAEKLNEILKSSKLSEETLDALRTMKAVADELEAHSTVGTDSVLQNAGMKAYDDKSVEEYRGSGTNGKVDDLEGIGESTFGDGIGGGGYGNGNGTGFGKGNGDGGSGNVTTKSGGYNKDGSPIGTAAITDTPDNTDADAIASYLATINGEPVINHIFHNDFYTNQPIVHWAYSVDFIPTISSDSLSQTDLFSIGQILTKAVQTVSVPERHVQSTVSHYKGMTIELPSRAKTCGTLNMKFAENNAFMVSTVLNTLFQFARSDDYYENIDYKIESIKPENDDQLKLVKQILRSYRAALPKGGHLFNILVKMYRMQDTKALDDVDSSEYPTFVYFYKGCDLKSVKQIEFNYDDDKPIDVPCEWMYQFFEEMTFDEYLQKYGSAADDTDIESKEDAIESQFESFDDSDLPSAQEGMDNLINGAKNSPILDKYLFGKDAGKYHDNSTGNRSPANMTSEGASNFVQDYAPKSPVTNSSQTTTVAYSTPGNFNRSGSR